MSKFFHPSESNQLTANASYLSEDTIAALATAVGGPVAIIRLSGPSAKRIWLALDQGKLGKGEVTVEPRRLYRTRLKFDDAMGVWFSAPHSFTGEEVVELHIHGGSYGSQRILAELFQQGARQALPGEFSFRAVRNGKMSITEAEAIADLIGAQNETAIAVALEKISGTQNQLLSAMVEDLRSLAAMGEVGIDFSDQDIEELSLRRLKERAAGILLCLERLAGSYDRGIRVQEGVSLSFVGLPNAGKSSLFNALLGEDRAIVSAIPGTTRDVVDERLTLRTSRSTITLRVQDTAGLRKHDDAPSDEVERIGMERTLASARQADLIVWVIGADQLGNLDTLQAHADTWQKLGRPMSKTLGVISKCDLAAETGLNGTGVKSALNELGVKRWVQCSASTGAGLVELIEAIGDSADHWVKRDPGEVLLTRMDQLQCLQATIEHLKRAAFAPEEDLFASDLRQALHALSRLAGQTLPDDLLGRIFSQFCIGK